MDYRIKKVGEGWEFLPQKERDEKREYENLTIRIIRREKKIESDLKKINDLKEELRDWKKKRTEGYHKMVKYHKKFLPGFSYFLDDKGFNSQWGVWVSIGGKRRCIYLGTVSSVSYHLDLLENNVPHYNEKNSFKDTVGYYEKLKPVNKLERGTSNTPTRFGGSNYNPHRRDANDGEGGRDDPRDRYPPDTRGR
jgi:hypothetical protein